MKRRVTPSFAEMVGEVRGRPAAEPAKRRPGMWGRIFVDRAGREYELVDDAVAPGLAREAARTGAQVVWDSCGCGGGCGWDWCTAEDVAEMARSGLPVIAPGTPGSEGSVRAYRAADGAVLLVVTGSVTWSTRLR